jgi:hypothetical protein
LELPAASAMALLAASTTLLALATTLAPWPLPPCARRSCGWRR